MFIKKGFSFFWAVSCQSLAKKANKSNNKNVSSKILFGHQKRRISRWFQIRWKSFKNWTKKKFLAKICTFSSFTHVRQTCFAYNFFLVHFLKNFLNGFEISMKFCVFWYLLWFFYKFSLKIILVSTFSNFEAKRAKNGSKNNKKRVK
jgi:hypothetical protein